VGKGGSGKTTLAALFARHLSHASGPSGQERGAPPVLAIDADINQHLAAALGAAEDEAVMLPSLGDHLIEIKEYLRGWSRTTRCTRSWWSRSAGSGWR
jgi:CO dehydrogenase maturation factor